MTFDIIHEHFTAVGCIGETIAAGVDWLSVKEAAHQYALETGMDATLTRVTVIKAPEKCLSI